MKALPLAAIVLFCLLPTEAWAHGIVPGIRGAFAAFSHTLTEMPTPLTLAALCAASAVSLSPSIGVAIAGLGGYLFGVFITPPPASVSTQAYMIAGGFIAANFALASIAAAIYLIRSHSTPPSSSKAWPAVALRVVASWIAAIAVLIAALSLR